ncbi:MAG: hypothetical protein ACJAVK_001412 [Akkermansiaceae bacterium]
MRSQAELAQSRETRFAGLSSTPRLFLKPESVQTGLEETSEVEITAIDYDRDAGMITLIWTSEPGKIYAIDASATLESWPADINDGLEGTEGMETTSYTSEDTGLGSQYFFRVREVTN